MLPHHDGMTPTLMMPRPFYGHIQRMNIASTHAAFPTLQKNIAARNIGIIGVGV